MKNIKLILKKNKKTGKHFYSILSSNGNNLNPTDPQIAKATVKHAMGSLIAHIQAGAFELIDETKPKKKNK